MMEAIGAINRQFNVIFALTVREMEDEFSKYKLGYFWALAEPAIYISLMTGVRVILQGAGANSGHGMQPITFSIVGVLPVLVVMRTLSHVAHTVEGGRSLLALPMVKTLDLVMARGLADFCTFGTTFILFVVPAALYEGVLPPRDPTAIAVLFIAAWLLGVGAGLALAPIFKFFPAIEHFQIILVRCIFWTSGLFFTVDQFPTWTWPYFSLNPVLQITELMRQCWFSVYTSPIASVSYLTLCVIGVWFVGTLMEWLFRPVHAQNG